MVMAGLNTVLQPRRLRPRPAPLSYCVLVDRLQSGPPSVKSEHYPIQLAGNT